MKKILTLFSLGFSISSFAQLIVYDYKPSVYLDSNKIDLEHYIFDQNKIIKFDVNKKAFQPTTNTNGVIYITSKKPGSFHFLSYAELKSKYFSDNKKPILLLMNGSFVKNPTKIFIDSTYISNIEVESGADYRELKNIYPLLSIVNIQTKNEGNFKEERRIKLNGVERQIFLDGLPSKSLPE